MTRRNCLPRGSLGRPLRAGRLCALTPGWPDDPETVEEANAHPEVFAHKTVGQVADHYAEVIGKLDRKPAVIGHSFGGLLTQIIAGRGLSAVSVAIDPAPFRGVLPLPISALKSASPVLGNPANRNRAVPLTYDQFRYGFANAVSEDEAKELYETYAVPASGAPIFQAAAANLNPWTEAKVDSKNPDRGPLLIISGEKDNTVPWAIANASYKKQKRNEGVTEIVEMPNRGHALTIDSGWREVAGTALAFVKRFAGATGAASATDRKSSWSAPALLPVSGAAFSRPTLTRWARPLPPRRGPVRRDRPRRRPLVPHGRPEGFARVARLDAPVPRRRHRGTGDGGPGGRRAGAGPGAARDPGLGADSWTTRREGRGPLEGIAAGLAELPGLRGGLRLLDRLPFLHPAFVASLLRALDDGHDAVLPHVHGHPQPLSAVYRPSLLPAVEELSRADGGSPRLPPRARPHDRARRASTAGRRGGRCGGPGLRSLVSLNDLDAYGAARAEAPPAVTVRAHGDPRTEQIVAAATLAEAATAAGVAVAAMTAVNGRLVPADASYPLVTATSSRSASQRVE